MIFEHGINRPKVSIPNLGLITEKCALNIKEGQNSITLLLPELEDIEFLALDILDEVNRLKKEGDYEQ